MSETSAPDREARIAERRKKIGMIARRLAAQEGREWKTLPQDERKVFNARARERMNARRAERAASTE